MRILELTALFSREGDLFVAVCPEIGTVSQGHTTDQAVANLREATELYLEEFPLTDDEPAGAISFRRHGPRITG